jgi:hypothetical protein
MLNEIRARRELENQSRQKGFAAAQSYAADTFKPAVRNGCTKAAGLEFPTKVKGFACVVFRHGSRQSIRRTARVCQPKA